MRAYATLERLKAFRNIGEKDGINEVAEEALQTASEWFRSAIGRELFQEDYAARLSGDGSRMLRPPVFPITSIPSLIVNDVEWEVLTSASVEDTGQEAFLPDHGRWIEAREGYIFTRGSGNVVLECVAGYRIIPEDAQSAVVMIAHLILTERNKLGEGVKRFGSERVEELLRDPSKYELIRETIKKFKDRGRA